VIGGILAAAGIPGFLGNREARYEEADGEGEAWRRLIEAWWESHHDAPVSAGQLFALADWLEGFDFGKGDDRARKISFGRQLAQQRDRVIGGYQVTFAGTVHHINRWQLVPLARATPTPEP
jgi:hypothetical protein